MDDLRNNAGEWIGIRHGTEYKSETRPLEYLAESIAKRVLPLIRAYNLTMQHPKLVVVQSYASHPEADLAKGALEAAGIQAMILENASSALAFVFARLAARGWNGAILRRGVPMKKLRLLMLTLLVATSSLAKTRDWKSAKIEAASETDVSWKLFGEKNTIHYTIETEDMVYFADYTYTPGPHSDSHARDIPVNEITKIAIEGRHAYVLDVNGKEVKLHIVRKTRK
jgi:hypothetical protein